MLTNHHAKALLQACRLSPVPSLGRCRAVPFLRRCKAVPFLGRYRGVPFLGESAEPIREDEKAGSGGYPLLHVLHAPVERASLDLFHQVLGFHKQGHVREIQQSQALGLLRPDRETKGRRNRVRRTETGSGRPSSRMPWD